MWAVSSAIAAQFSPRHRKGTDQVPTLRAERAKGRSDRDFAGWRSGVASDFGHTRRIVFFGEEILPGRSAVPNSMFAETLRATALRRKFPRLCGLPDNLRREAGRKH